MASPATLALRQDDGEDFDAGKELLELLKDPFGGQLQQTSLWSALAISLGFTVFIGLCFSFLRPYNQAVYAPKLKHADERHAPPPIGKKLWSWLEPLWRTTETEIISRAGLDAALFLRFTRMCRDMFAVCAVVCCCILIPVHVTTTNAKVDDKSEQWLAVITPAEVPPSSLWAHVAVGYLLNVIVCGFLWWNYRKVLQMRRAYFDSEDYRNSLHARTLMLFDLPRDRCSDEGIARLIDEVAPNSSFARTVVARNVRDLPDLIREHEGTVRKLEKVLATYLKNPDQLPAARPMCKPSRKDPSFDTYPAGQKVDAIEYLTQRIKDLELLIREVRQSVDRRSTMPYGFASYADIPEAHSIAFNCRRKHPGGSTIVLAPRPNDIIWDNMPLSASVRSWKRKVNNFWIAMLTILWIAPNAMIAIFLVNLNNLGRVWPAFKENLIRNRTGWGIVQGIASPAVMSLVYLVLPIIFRRLSMAAGDRTKTGRERHVVGKLYAFFVFNNLIVFSFFSTVWSIVAGIIQATSHGGDAWQAIVKSKVATALFLSLCQVSPFWITWLLQRQLGAAIDLSQLWPLIYGSLMKRFSSPTPRELIELTAPPAFDYASYYNYFLFYATVALGYSSIQPLVLLAAAMYFALDVCLKKYLLMYIFVTKTESGGMFWRVLFNRFIFATILADLVYFLTTFVRGDQDPPIHAIAVVPLPFLVIAFKVYCARTFDRQMYYYATRSAPQNPESGAAKDLRNDRLASRFGHPALYRPLVTPMVHQKAQNMLHVVYRGRLSDGRDAGSGDMMSVSGYSDTYAMDSMKSGKPGKAANVPGFEFVAESHLDFEYYKSRPEFANEHGAGDLFGRPSDIIRTGTPASGLGSGSSEYGGSRPGTPLQDAPPMPAYPRGLQGQYDNSPGQAPYRVASPYRSASPSPYMSTMTSPPNYMQTHPAGSDVHSLSPLYPTGTNESTAKLVGTAAEMPTSHSRSGSMDMLRSVGPSRGPSPGPSPGPSTGALGGGPRGYSGLPQSEGPEQTPMDPTQYNYFRGTRPRRDGSGAW